MPHEEQWLKKTCKTAKRFLIHRFTAAGEVQAAECFCGEVAMCHCCLCALAINKKSLLYILYITPNLSNHLKYGVILKISLSDQSSPLIFNPFHKTNAARANIFSGFIAS